MHFFFTLFLPAALKSPYNGQIFSCYLVKGEKLVLRDVVAIAESLSGVLLPKIQKRAIPKDWLRDEGEKEMSLGSF